MTGPALETETAPEATQAAAKQATTTSAAATEGLRSCSVFRLIVRSVDSVPGNLGQPLPPVRRYRPGALALRAIPKPLENVDAIWATTDPPGDRTVVIP